MWNATSWCLSVLGSWFYFLFFVYGPSWCGCGGGQFCGSTFDVHCSANRSSFRETDTTGNYNVTINGIFGAGGDTLFDMYSLAVCMWCLAISLAAVGTYDFHWPVVVIYACTCIDEVGKLPWVLHHFRKYK